MQHHLLWITATAVLWVAAGAAPIDEKDVKDARNCKSLCSQCGCIGFYCGEECICECNKDTTEYDSECIGTMQDTARKMNVPFELLIQGPSQNKFVQNAQNFKQNDEQKHCAATRTEVPRQKRSSVVIYKPSPQNSLDGHYERLKPAVMTASTDGKGKIKKRSVDGFEWFSDSGSSLVRPAPFGRGLLITDEYVHGDDDESDVQKRSVDNMDRSWFEETKKSLLCPSRLFRNEPMCSEDYLAAPPPPLLPQLKERIQKLKDLASSDDIVGELRAKVKSGSEFLRSKFNGDEIVSSFRQRLDGIRSRTEELLKSGGRPLRDGLFQRTRQSPVVEPVNT